MSTFLAPPPVAWERVGRTMVIGMEGTWRILSIRGSIIIVTLVVMFVVGIVMIRTGPIRNWMLERRLDRRRSRSEICRRLAIEAHTYWRPHKNRLIMFVRGSMLWRARSVRFMRPV